MSADEDFGVFLSAVISARKERGNMSKDISEKRLEEHNDVFAGIFNKGCDQAIGAGLSYKSGGGQKNFEGKTGKDDIRFRADYRICCQKVGSKV